MPRRRIKPKPDPLRGTYPFETWTFKTRHEGHTAKFELSFDMTGPDDVLTEAKVTIDDEPLDVLNGKDANWTRHIKKTGKETRRAFSAAAEKYIDRKYPKKGPASDS